MKKILLIIFSIIFIMLVPIYSQDKKEEVSVVETTQQSPELSLADNILYVKNAPIGSKIEIITIVGSKIKEIEVKSSEGSYELNLPRAIYIFKLEGTVRKFVIR